MDSTPLPPSTPSIPKKEPGETAESGKPIKCDLCNVWCQGVVSHQSHLQGRQHYANLKPQDATNGEPPRKGKKRPSGTAIEEVRCEICNISCLGKVQYDAHVQGIKHAKRAKLGDRDGVDISTMPFIKELGGKNYECTICSVQVTGKSVIVSHVGGSKHQRKADPSIPKPVEMPGKKNETSTPTGEPLECKICKLPVNSLFQLGEHEKSVRHQHKLDLYNKSAMKEADIGKNYDAWDPTG